GSPTGQRAGARRCNSSCRRRRSSGRAPSYSEGRSGSRATRNDRHVPSFAWVRQVLTHASPARSSTKLGHPYPNPIQDSVKRTEIGRFPRNVRKSSLYRQRTPAKRSQHGFDPSFNPPEEERMRAVGRSLMVLLIVGGAAAAHAQVQTGSILVKASDEQGAVMPGVTITVSGPQLVAPVTGISDTTGVYRFISLPPAPTYVIRMELQGFQTQVREGVVVATGQTTPIDVSMRVGSVSESVTVRGESPVIDTTSANVNVHIDSKLLETTPSGRDIWSLIEYKAPGIVMATPDVGGSQGGLQRGLSARGTSNGQNTQMLNGVNVGDPAAIGFAGYYYDPSAFEDIQVSSGAQDITVPSSGVFINMVTKSGSNTISGSGLFTYQGEKTQWDNIDQ